MRSASASPYGLRSSRTQHFPLNLQRSGGGARLNCRSGPNQVAKTIRVPQAQHKYNYANSDPINRIDPSGRDSLIEYSLEDSEIPEEEEGGIEAKCAVVKNLCWSGCFLAVTSAGIHGADVFGNTRACTRRCMAAAGCFNY